MRFFIVLALLGATAVLLHSRSRAENLPPRMEFGAFPPKIGDWEGTEQPIPADDRKVLGEGDFLYRIYRRDSREPYIDIFLAYFPSQRAGSTFHSPQHCLPGEGWTPLEHTRIRLAPVGKNAPPVNLEYIAKGSLRQVVLYWYQVHGRVVASDYWARFYLVADSIKLHRSDGAMVRIITPLAQGEPPDAGLQRLMKFVREMSPLLGPYIPS